VEGWVTQRIPVATAWHISKCLTTLNAEKKHNISLVYDVFFKLFSVLLASTKNKIHERFSKYYQANVFYIYALFMFFLAIKKKIQIRNGFLKHSP
jgi:hypothetical protein